MISHSPRGGPEAGPKTQKRGYLMEEKVKTMSFKCLRAPTRPQPRPLLFLLNQPPNLGGSRLSSGLLLCLFSLILFRLTYRLLLGYLGNCLPSFLLLDCCNVRMRRLPAEMTVTYRRHAYNRPTLCS